MKSLHRLIVEYSCGIKDNNSAQECILYLIDKDPCIPDIAYTVCGVDHPDTEKSLICVAKYFDNHFSLTNKESEMASAELLADVGKSYLKRKKTPKEVCDLVQLFDTRFMEVQNEECNWLGDLWNLFDWCDESWSFDNKPHLAKEIEAQVAIIEQWLKTNKKIKLGHI